MGKKISEQQFLTWVIHTPENPMERMRKGSSVNLDEKRMS